jgi:ABC-type transport system substrate-binding protein
VFSFLARLLLAVPLLGAIALAQPLDISTNWPAFSQENVPEGKYGGVLRVPWSWYSPFSSLNVVADPMADALLSIIYPKVMASDAVHDGIPDCYLCQSYEVSTDGTEVTFRLREGIRWSDGTPLTAKDVVASAKIFGDPDYGGNYRRLVMVGEDLVEYEAVDDTTVVLRLPRALSEATWKDMARIRVLPRHVFGRAYERGGIAAVKELYPLGTEEIVSAGAWRFGSYNAKDGLVLLENREGNWVTDAYGNKLPYVDEYRQFGVGDSNEAELLLGGDADIAPEVSEGLLLDELRGAGHQLVTPHTVSSTMLYVIPNFLHPDPEMRTLMRDRRFRRALSMLINRQGFGRELYGELAQPVFNWNDRQGFVDLGYPRFGYDTRKAHSLFEELGLRRDQARTACPAGCYVHPSGDPLLIELSHFDRAELNEGAVLLIETLRAAGLEVSDGPDDVYSMVDRVFTRGSELFREFDLWYDKRGGAIDGREFYSAVFGLGADYRYWGVGPDPGVGPADVQPWEVRLSELAATIESDAPLAKKVAAAAEATVIFAEELPMVPMVSLTRYQGYVGNLANTFDQVSDDFSNVFFNGENVQVLYYR